MENFDIERIKSLERKITQLSILYSIASSIGVTSDEKKILELVIDGIMDNLTPETGIIFLVDKEKNELFPVLSRGIKLEEISRISIKKGRFISGICFEKGEFLEEEIEREKISLLEPFLKRLPVKKVICMPIKSHERVLGVIHLSKFSKVSLTEEEKWILTILANRAGVAIESANLYRELESWGKSLELKVEERTREIKTHLERIKALEKITLKISSEMNISKSLPFIGRESSKIIGADKWAIFVVSKYEREVISQFSSGLSDEYLKTLKNLWEKIEGAKVIYSQKPIFIEDVLKIENPYSKKLAQMGGYRSFGAIPCNYRKILMGVLVYYHNLPKTYSEQDREIAMAFGELIALAIANSNLFERQRRTIKQLKAVNKLGKVIASSLNLQKIYDEAVELLQRIQNYPFVFILIYDKSSNKLVQVARGGWLKEKVPKKYSQSPEKGIIGRVFKTGKIYVSGDVKNDPHYLPYFEEVNSEIAVPIKDKDGNVIGVIDVQSENLNAFSKEDIETISTIADQLSIMIENLELYKNLTYRIKEISTFYNISQELSGILNLEELLSRIIINLKPLVPFTSGGILIYNQNLNALEVKAYLGPKLDEFKGMVEVGRGITGYCFKQKKPIIVNDVRKDSRYIPGAPEILSEIAVPLFYQNEVIGVLNLESSRLNEYTEEHLRILNSFASLSAIAIRNAMLFEEIKKRAEEMRVLNEISSVSISTLDLRKLYKILSEKIMKIFNVDTYYLAICDIERDEVSFPVFLDRGKPLRVKPIKISQTSGLTAWIIRNKKPIMFNDYEKERESLPVRAIIITKPAQSYIGVPIILKNKVLGVISIQSYKKNAFSSWHLDLLNTIANHIALSLENARLFKDVKETLKKLKASQAKLVQTEKMRALGIVSAGIAHQFNNILSAILARAQLLSKRTNDPEFKRNLEIIEKASLGGAEIIRRLLGFSKTSEKKVEIVNVKNSIEEAIELTEVKWRNEAEAMGKRIEMRKELGEGLFVKGNSSELREAIVNIILNSVDAIKKEGFIDISAYLSGKNVLIGIRDNGIGIPPSQLDKVFDPFFTTKGISGTGLGLSYVYGVVKKFKGDIKIESKEGEGTTVLIKLPRVRKKIEEKEKFEKVEKIPLKILVIEDEEHVIDLIEEILKINGHHVVLARSGVEGISKFEKENFDLVMTDLGLPGISGWEVAEKIRKINPDVRIGIITGWNIKGEIERIKNLNIDFVITKPFKIEDLLSVLSPIDRRKEVFVN